MTGRIGAGGFKAMGSERELEREFEAAGEFTLFFVAFLEEVDGRAALASDFFLAASSFFFASSNF